MDWLAWIKVAENREILTYIGGGLTVVGGGIWRYYVWRHPKIDTPVAPVAPTVQASTGGISVGVSGDHNQIHIGK